MSSQSMDEQPDLTTAFLILGLAVLDVVLLAVSFYYTLFTSNWVAAVYGLALCGIATLAVHLCMRAWDLPRD